MRSHPLRTVAQFRYDDGWARVHNSGERDTLRMEPTGELRARRQVKCDHPRCSRSDVFRDETLYPLLDWARENGKDVVPLG